MVVARVAGDEQRGRATDHDRDMVWRVPRRRHDENITRLRQRHALPKRTEGASVEPDETRLPPPRPAVRQVTLDSSAESGGSLEFLFRYPGAGAGQVFQAARMICVEMRQYDVADISGTDPQVAQLGSNLFVGVNGKMRGPPVKRVPAREVALQVDSRGFPRIDEDHSFFMLDRPSVDGKPLGPLRVNEHVGDTGHAFSL